VISQMALGYRQDSQRLDMRGMRWRRLFHCPQVFWRRRMQGTYNWLRQQGITALGRGQSIWMPKR